MKTNCDAAIQVMPSAKRSGKERILLISLTFFLLIVSSSCGRQTPIISPHSLPVSYDTSSVSPVHYQSTSADFHVIRVNDSSVLNNRVIFFWKKNEFSNLFEKYHPVVRYDRADIAVLKDAITRLFDIYYFHSDKNARILKEKQDVKKYLSCNPLTNHELQFLMSTSIEDAFPRKALTMLFISSHELLLNTGAKPDYPQVHSDYLRKRYKLPQISSFEGTNLFATKNHNDVYSANASGFIYCRKNR